MEEESENKNSIKKHPSLPPNYVTLAMLKERWLQRKKEEEEEKLKQQQSKEEEKQPSGSKQGIASTNRNENRRESRPAYLPRHRQQQPPVKDRRGAEGWVRKSEAPESSGSVVVAGNPEVKETMEENYQIGSKPRVMENEISPQNVAGKEEFPIEISASEVIAGNQEIKEKKYQRGSKPRVVECEKSPQSVAGKEEIPIESSASVAIAGNQEIKEKKMEKEYQRGSKPRVVECEKYPQNVAGKEEIPMESSDSVAIVGNQEIKEKKMEKKYQRGSKPRVVENEKPPQNVAGKEEFPMESSASVVIGGNQEIKERKYQRGSKSRVMVNEKSPQNIAGKEENPMGSSTSVVVIGGNQEIKEKNMGKKYHRGSRPRVVENEKSPQNVSRKEEIPTVVSEESGGKGEFCGELQLGGDDGGGSEERASVCMIEVVSENGVERDIQKVSGGERRQRKKWGGGFRRQENRRWNFKINNQVGDLGQREMKAEDVPVAEDRRENGKKWRQSGTGHLAVKIDESFQDLLLDDGKDANVTMGVTDSGGQQENTQRMNFKVDDLVGELGDKANKVEERVVGEAMDGRENGDEWRVRNGNVRNGGRHGYRGYRRVPQGNRLMWVKKGEYSGGNVTEFTSQVHP